MCLARCVNQHQQANIMSASDARAHTMTLDPLPGPARARARDEEMVKTVVSARALLALRMRTSPSSQEDQLIMARAMPAP